MAARRFLDRGEWQYARLVLVLLVVAGLSTKWVVAGLARDPVLAARHDVLAMLSITITVLTMGFLFRAGAFGIWAIRSTQAVEGRRRFLQFIEDMDYLADGIVLADARGRIHGMNAAARALTADVRRAFPRLGEAYPCLGDDDVAALLDGTAVRELERVAREGDALYSLRFRSQPAEDFTILMVSDVTAAKTRQMREVQAGHLQLIGRIARGVSHDFNNILCAISAHAGLFTREGADPDSLRLSGQTIIAEAARGSRLARQVIKLGELDAPGEPVTDLRRHLDNVVELLKVVLPPLWTFRVLCRGRCLPLPLAGHQLEQVLLNLGLQAAEAFEVPGEVAFSAEPGSWSRQGPRDVVVRVQAAPAVAGDPAGDGDGHLVAIEDGGVIESIVRSVVETAGGDLEIHADHHGRHRYVLRIPGLPSIEEMAAARTGLSDEQCRQVAGWHVLLARAQAGRVSHLESRMRGLGISVEFATDLSVVLGLLEGPTPFNAAILDRRLLGESADALLHAIVKLRPGLGLVVLTDSAEDPWRIARPDIAYLPPNAAPETVLDAMIRSRELVVTRAEFTG